MMKLKAFIKQYRANNMAMLANELNVSRTTIKNWIEKFDIEIENDRANIIRITKTSILYERK